MIVLGIDGGFGEIGWSVLQLEDGKKPVCLDCGIIKTTKAKKSQHLTVAEDDFGRAQEIYRRLKEIISKYEPVFIAAESPSWCRRVNSDRKVAMFWGVLPSLIEETGLAIALRTPKQLKEEMLGKGTKGSRKNEMIEAAKHRVSGAAERIESIRAKSRHQHVADAMAAALSAQRSNLFKSLKSALKAVL